MEEPTAILPVFDQQLWLDRFFDDRVALGAVFVVLVLAWFIVVRVIKPTRLGARYRRIFWAIDVVLVPPSIVVAGALVRIVAEDLGLSDMDPYIRAAALIASHATIGILAATGIDLFFLQSSDSTRRYGTAIGRGLLYAVAVIIALTVFMAREGYDISGVLVSTGLAAAAVAFALQQTLRDWLSGIALTVEAPIAVGDWLQLEDGTLGQVMDITWRSTWLKSWNNTLLIVPNSQLASVRVENLSGPVPHYSPWYMLKVPVELEPVHATNLILEAALRCKFVLRDPAPTVRLMDATSKPYTYAVWVSFENYPSMFRGREQLFQEIDRALRSVGVTPSAPITEFHAREVGAPLVSPPTLQETLQASPLLGSLSTEALQKLASNAEIVTFEADEVVMVEGTMVTASHVVVSGRLEGVSRSASGSEFVTERFVSGDAFGFASMLTIEPAFLSVRAVTDATTIRLSTDCMREALLAEPQLRTQMADILNQRIKNREDARQMTATSPSRPLTLREIRRRLDKLLGLDNSNDRK